MQDINIGHGSKENNNLAELSECAERKGRLWWTVNSKAKAGARIAIYLTPSQQQLVAVGRLLSDATLDHPEHDEWPDRYMAVVGDLRMINPYLSRHQVMTHFPGWGYWKQPRQSTRVPDEYAAEFLRMINSKARGWRA